MEHRYVTALYRSHSAAELVRQELQTLGVAHGDITIVPDPQSGTAVTEDRGARDRLRGLDLPDDDLNEYERRVREGDVVVSAKVGSDLVADVEEAMRRPGEFAHMHGDPLDSYRTAPATAGGFAEGDPRDGFAGRDRDRDPLRPDDSITPSPAGGTTGQIRRSD